ncbi:MAG: acyl-CoA thioesterase II, partial [Pseudomonadota bacterium]
PHSYLWLRPTRALQASPTVHQCILAYSSDLTLLDTACRPHGVTWGIGKIQAASLDHAMWFHAPIPLDDWLLYYKDSPNASGGRGFVRGSFFTRHGQHLASVAQEGLIRPVRPQP